MHGGDAEPRFYTAWTHSGHGERNGHVPVKTHRLGHYHPWTGGHTMGEARVERRLAAILAADVTGYSRLMGADEVGTLAALKQHRRDLVDPTIAAHRGRIVKTTGDGMLIEFASAVDAVTCARAVQSAMPKRNDGAANKIIYRIGINVGDIIIDGDDIFGDGVNVAARVENECEPGGVYVSGSAFEQVRGKTSFVFDDLGKKSLKNIDRPVRLYAMRARDASPAVASRADEVSAKPLPLSDKPSIAVLPFQNMSGDPEQEYFADGIAEDVPTTLSKIQELLVIARSSQSFIWCPFMSKVEGGPDPTARSRNRRC